MNVITNKALVIAVGIFITIAITSAILITIDQMKNVYSSVYETDINISSGFQEFDEYDNTEKTGVDLINTLKKYRNNSNVKIIVNGYERNYNNNYITSINTPENYSKSYKCSIKREGDNTTIYFSNN